MKRFSALILALVIILSCLFIPAAATEIPQIGQNIHMLSITSEQDLGTSDYISLTMSDFQPSTTLVTVHEYRTNSTRLVVKMKSDIDTVIKVRLFRADTDAEVAVVTLNVGSTYEYARFTNLSYEYLYYFKFDNLSQQKVNIEGRITAAYF